MDEQLLYLSLFEQQKQEIETLRLQVESLKNAIPKKQPSSLLCLTEYEMFDLYRMYGQLPEEHALVNMVTQNLSPDSDGEINLRDMDPIILNLVYRELLKKEKIDRVAELEKKTLFDQFKVQSLMQENSKLGCRLDESIALCTKMTKAAEQAKLQLVELTPLVKQNELLKSFLKKTEDTCNAVFADTDARMRKIRSTFQLVGDTLYQVDLQQLRLCEVAPRIMSIIKAEDHIAALKNIVGHGQLLTSSSSGMNLNEK